MKKVKYLVDCCVDCPFFQDYSKNENFEANCVKLNKDFNFPEEGCDSPYWFPDFCPLEEGDNDVSRKDS